MVLLVPFNELFNQVLAQWPLIVNFRDKFGVSWQIVPPVLGEMLNDEDDEKSQRVMQAMLQMEKLDIKPLKQAYEQQ